MAIRNRTIIRQEVAFAAGDTPITDNLPVNPLSFIDIVLRYLNATANTVSTIVNALATLNTLEVLFRGSSIISLSPRDLYALQGAMGWVDNMAQPRQYSNLGVNRLLLRLGFSRKNFWTKEGFPASRAGELQIRYTPAATFTNVGTVSLQVETEEILDAQFSRFLKYTTLSRTPTATGESDQDLPLGNKYAGILLFGTTVPTALTVTASMREVRMLIDNQEAFVPRTRWDTLHQTFQQKHNSSLWYSEHIHVENTAGVYAQNALTLAPQIDVHALNTYGFIDFDPLKDDDYLINTQGRSSVKLRINADVADAQRIIPIELLEIAGAPAAPA